MNENNQLGENETLLLMRDGSRGKTVSGTRVFKDLASFAKYLQSDDRGIKNWRDFFSYKEVGENVISGKKVNVVTKAGFIALNWTVARVYVASDTKTPRRIKVTPQMVGFEEPEYA